MANRCMTDEAQDSAALYALGLLEPELVPDFELHLQGCTDCQAELREFSEAAAQLVFTEPIEPPPHLRGRVLSAVGSRSSPIFIRRAGDGAWMETPFPGVRVKPLFEDPETGLLTQLIRLKPGARIPAHKHSKPESCYVLEGDVKIGGDYFGMGDFSLAPVGTLHGEVFSRGGCLLLITSNPHDEVTA